MTGVVPIIPRFRFNDSSGNPLAGGSVTVYLAGTTTLANTYQDQALTTPNTNPVTLDANGECLFWVDSAYTYKLLLKDAAGATVSGWPVDNIPGAANIGAAVTAATAAAATSAANAAASEGNAAASAIAAQAAANLFTTTTLGIAGTSSGQYFAVPQANSDAADVYQNVAGVATATSLTVPYTGTGQQAVQIKVAELSSANLTNYPYTPSIEVYGVDSYDKNGVYVPNRYASSQPGGNLVARSSGSIQTAATMTATTTEYYANGPAGNLTAMRIHENNGQYWSPLREVLPAGTYTARWKLKAATGTTPTVQCGDQNATPGTPLTSFPLTDAAWTTVTFTYTASGANTPWPIVINNSGVAVDLLVDEVQIYQGSSIPVAYSAEVNNQGHLVPITAKLPGKFKRAGNSLDTTGVTGGVLKFSTYPLQKSVSEITLVAVVATNDNTTVAAKAMSLTDANGTLDVGVYLGAPFGNPAAPLGQYKGNGGGATASQMMSIVGKGYQIIATRCKASEQSFFFHGIEYARKTTAFGPVNISKLSAFTDSNGTSFPLKGNASALLVFEKWLTNTELSTVMQSLRQRHALYGLQPITTGFNFVIAEGDSITDCMSGPASNGGYTNLYFNTYAPANAYCKNIALSGSTYSTMNSRLPEIQRMGPQVLATTGKPMIVSVFIGANGVLTTGAGGQWDTYLAAVRAAGAKIIACTLLPRSGVAGFEASRIAFNSYVRATPSQYDALCDFGDTASVMGQPNSFTDTPANWIDATHPSNAGHLLMLPTWKTALESLLL